MSRDERGVSTLIIILSVALVLAGLIVGYVLLRPPASTGPASTRRVPSAEQKAYFTSLEFAELHMSAAENFLGTTVTYLDARVSNKGAKTVRHLDVELNFVDVLNQVVLRETAHPVTRRAPPLQPGETRPFRVTFEHMPMDWNQAPPSITPVYLEF
jgi:hypothetical protein